MTKWKKRDRVRVGDHSYTVLRVLGKQPGGDLYLVTEGGQMFTLEECSYLTQEEREKYIAEAVACYNCLRQIGINVPKLVCADAQAGILMKKYIGGEVASNLILTGALKPENLEQAAAMSKAAEKAGVCLDYFPTNYVVCEKQIYYLRYYCTAYDEKDNFDHRGCKYWMRAGDLMKSIAGETDKD